MNTVALDTTSNTAVKTINVAIVGGGITGLAAAYRLLQQSTQRFNFKVSIFEADARVGGIISTRHEKECIYEDGPDSFITMKPAAIALSHELGLSDRIVTTNAKFRRAFVAWNHCLEPIPEGFNMIAPTRFDKLFTSNLFSRTGKLRMAMEQFIPKAPRQEDESVASFVRRRFGTEALTRIGQPMLGGIYTANPEHLSLRTTMPKYLEYEQTYGSVTKGLMAEQAAQTKEQGAAHAGARYSAFISFDRGLGVLVDTLIAAIGDSNIFTSTKISDVKYSKKTNQWSLSLPSGESKDFDHIVLTTPSFVTSQLLAATDEDLAKGLSDIEYASSAVLNFLFKREQINHPLDGFGFVVPQAEKSKIIAGSFYSVKFTDRCPDNMVIVRAFLGGAMQEEILKNDNETLIELALSELNQYIKITGAPLEASVKRYPRSMPQFKVNHHLLREKLLAKVEKHPGLHLSGAYLNGVGIPDCIASANKSCDDLLKSLNLTTSG